MVSVVWPAVTYEERRWIPHPASRGPRADRLLGTYRSAVVPPIADIPVELASIVSDQVSLVEDEIAALRAPGHANLAALTGALLRSESVASSKIEHLSARQADIALAAHGVPARSGGRQGALAARAVAANIAAMAAALAAGDGSDSPVTVQDILTVHHALLAGDEAEAYYAGRIRDVQNWIGGSDHSPRDALFVPPHPDRLADGLADLLRFCGRRDVSPVVVAAIAHAQFETLHPFTDGNGRTGRALVHLLWRRTRFSPALVVPVSTVLLSDVDAYFSGLTRYREGDVDAWVAQFAAAAGRAAIAGRRLVGQVADLRASWQQHVAPRAGSAVAALLDLALTSPVLDIGLARLHAKATDANLYLALGRLCKAGVVEEVTGHGRNRVWMAADVFDLLEAFERQVGRRSRPNL